MHIKRKGFYGPKTQKVFDELARQKEYDELMKLLEEPLSEILQRLAKLENDVKEISRDLEELAEKSDKVTELSISERQ